MRIASAPAKRSVTLTRRLFLLSACRVNARRDSCFGRELEKDSPASSPAKDSSRQIDFSDFNALDHQPGFRVGDAEVRDARSSARAAWIRQMADAWNQSPPSRDAAARPDLDPDDDPGARMRGHLQTESNEESQRRRDAAWGAYKDQLANAWMMGRTNPQAATAVERQRRQWTAEPMRGA